MASPAVCLDFDLACREFWRWAEARANETESRPVKQSASKTPTERVPKYRTLAQVLGLDADDEDVSELPPIDFSRYPDYAELTE